MSPHDKPLLWLHGSVRTPPMSTAARVEVGYQLRRLQRGESIGLPHSRPLPIIGPRCHELRVVLLPDSIRRACQQRLKDYDDE